MTGYVQVEKLLSDVIGLDPESIGCSVIKNEVDSLMRVLRMDDVSLYVDRLKADEEELGRLVERIVVPETWFFRDREAYRFLRQYAKEICPGKGDGVVRVLSAPCSTGEEPYSVVMTLFDAGLTPGDFVVDAIDISERALGRARQAEYGKASFRGEKHHPDSYFIPQGDRWKIDSRITAPVHFIHDNIMRPDFSADHGTYGIVFCRNLLIYLDKEGRRRLFECMERLLLPGGLLFVGHSELASFLQKGYIPVAHSRSFACIKSSEIGLPKPEITEPVTIRKQVGMKPVERRKPVDAALPTSRPGKRRSERTGQVVDAMESPLLTIRHLADRGSLVEAAGLCEKYLRENGPDKEGFYLMGLIGQALDRPEQAEDMFMKALYLDPSHYEALLHMALLSEQRGDGARARVFRERIKRLEGGTTVPGGQP